MTAEGLLGACIKWLALSKSQEARSILRLSSDEYAGLDPDLEQFDLDYKNILYEVKARLSGKTKFVGSDDWCGKQHLDLLRSSKIRDSYIKSNTILPVNIWVTLNYYKQQLDEVCSVWFDKFMSDSGVYDMYDPLLVSKNLSDLTSLVKKYRERVFGEKWYYLCDLSSLFGYNMRTKLKDMDNKIVEWCEKKEQISNEYLEFGVGCVVDMVRDNPTIRSISIDNFLLNPNLWVVSGSSNGIKTTLWDRLDKSEVKSGSKKAAIFCEYSKERLKSMMLNTNIQPFKPSVKIEIGWKERLIIACDNAEYLRMAYLSYTIEKIFHGSEISTLFENSNWKSSLYCKKEYNGIYLPFDAAGFDHYCRLDEIRYVYKAIRVLIHKYFKYSENKSDMLLVLDLLTESMNKWSIRLYNGSIIKWEDGLPSGLRWTAFLGTIINVTRAKFINHKIFQLHKFQAISKVVGQGDDDDFELNSWLGALYIWIGYKELKIPAHKAKNFCDNRYTEFLKRLVDTKKRIVTGYPARKVCNLFFVSPERLKGEDLPWAEINYNIWASCTLRGLSVSRDNFQSAEVFNLMYYPKCLGGFGVTLFDHKHHIPLCERKVLSNGRFEISKIKRNTSLYEYTRLHEAVLKDFSINVSLLRLSFRLSFGSRVVPQGYNNIKAKEYVKMDILPFEEGMAYDELLVLLRLAKGLNFEFPRLKDEYSFLDSESVLSLLGISETVQFVQKFYNPESLYAWQLILDKYEGVERTIRLRELLKPTKPYKISYSRFYSDDFLSSIFQTYTDRLTIFDIIYDNFGISSSDLSWRNKKIRFEAGMFRILNGKDEECSPVELVQIVGGFNVISFN